MHRGIIVPGALGAACLMLVIPASAAARSPGAPGIGDPYYPAYGDGGYDVSHYDLRLKYRPDTDRLEGTATGPWPTSSGTPRRSPASRRPRCSTPGCSSRRSPAPRRRARRPPKTPDAKAPDAEAPDAKAPDAMAPGAPARPRSWQQIAATNDVHAH